MDKTLQNIHKRLVCSCKKWYYSNIIKLFLIKHKRILWIALAVLFVVVLFLSKSTNFFQNIRQRYQSGGLTYNTVALESLVTKDTDGDGIMDWEEPLWGTDPTKRDTNMDGVEDGVEIEKLKKEKIISSGVDLNSQNIENLTETDKFAREFFSTVATLNQNGEVDQETVNKLSASLAEHVQNSTQRTTYSISNIKISKDTSINAVKKYDTAMDKLYLDKYPIIEKVVVILEEFMGDGENINLDTLNKLNPIINTTNELINGMQNISVPEQFSVLHLSVLNDLQKVYENLNDITIFETDPIMTLGAISNFPNNAEILDTSIQDLGLATWKKLNN